MGMPKPTGWGPRCGLSVEYRNVLHTRPQAAGHHTGELWIPQRRVWKLETLRLHVQRTISTIHRPYYYYYYLYASHRGSSAPSLRRR